MRDQNVTTWRGPKAKEISDHDAYSSRRPPRWGGEGRSEKNLPPVDLGPRRSSVRLIAEAQVVLLEQDDVRRAMREPSLQR
eukprot:4441084-Pyramimonas_sp.AAC.1